MKYCINYIVYIRSPRPHPPPSLLPHQHHTTSQSRPAFAEQYVCVDEYLSVRRSHCVS